MGGNPNSLPSRLMNPGAFRFAEWQRTFGGPVSGVSIRIADLDLMQEALSGRLVDRAFSFPVPVHYTGFRKPLYYIKATPDAVYKRFNIFITARNGDFIGLVRVRRQDAGGWGTANRVIASFYDKRRGIVLERNRSWFPQGYSQI